MNRVHLICNAHLDPVWLWEWEEGAAAAISTFRTAADLCEEFKGFVFNHNEAVLYQWVEEHEPLLFRRIAALVKKKQWHIMGGWYLQPDCNMPAGESFVRQILLGTNYFKDRFGVKPKIAINFDSFGHSRGLVQILAKTGYEGYLCCRPSNEFCPLPANEFVWEGFDDSKITVFRAPFYNSALGKAVPHVKGYLKNFKDSTDKLILWGVGDHGGGASRKDLTELRKLIKLRKDFEISHSTPEAYFGELNKRSAHLPVFSQSLAPFAVGCYTSQVRIKQKHRQLENELFSTEKMNAAASILCKMPYPKEVFLKAGRDLAFSQFHDILPGSSIQNVEDMALRVIDHGLEELSRIKAHAFFCLTKGQIAAKNKEIPILVYNPHPYPVTTNVECEFQLEDQNWKDTFTDINLFQDGKKIFSQVEKEVSNLNLDWRKRLVFRALLKPFTMNRFDCKLKVLKSKPVKSLPIRNNNFCFKTRELEIKIDRKTGLMNSLCINGNRFLKPNACKATVIRDNEDAWGMNIRSFNKTVGAFKLMTAQKSARFAGVHKKTLPPVHVIEDGDVRTVIESFFSYNNSTLCLRYKLPKKGTEIEVELRLFWNEKDKMLKFSLPLEFKASLCGQTAFGINPLKADGEEKVAQKWIMAEAVDKPLVFTVINTGTYGLSFENDEIRLSLIRSPAYSGHPLMKRDIVPQDRLTPRIDQGERVFRFFLNGGTKEACRTRIDRDALVKNETPMALSFFPSGADSVLPEPLVLIEGEGVQLSAVKKSEKGNNLILRMYEPTGFYRKVKLSLPSLGIHRTINFKKFEIKTFLVDIIKKTMIETDLLEEPLSK